MSRFAKAASVVSALSLAAVGYASSPASAATGIEIQNQATGLCLSATVDSWGNVEDIGQATCGASKNEYWANQQSKLISLSSGSVNLCLTTDNYSDAFTTGCGNTNGTGYGQDWSYTSIQGAWTVIYSSKGCYLTAYSKSAACVGRNNASSQQWRVLYW
ncbi:ricin-type beta-trefoil lectin domain protein [Kitasatospora sp. McL0602]|uniref:ricin-type beta-trefoil lectin domain protein n=1 Tax=Kitasatospora sp. McL0602 TaxID=3439530 RepID=UPI003F8B6626